jgi:hypothetical protein
MRDTRDSLPRRAVIFYYRDAPKDWPLQRGYGLIEDDIHALIEATLEAEAALDHAPQTAA